MIQKLFWLIWGRFGFGGTPGESRPTVLPVITGGVRILPTIQAVRILPSIKGGIRKLETIPS